MKIEITPATFKKVLGKALALLPFIATLSVISLIAYGGWTISQTLNIAPSGKDIEVQREKLTSQPIHFDVKTIDSVNSLVQVQVPINLDNLGKNDPFAP